MAKDDKNAPLEKAVQQSIIELLKRRRVWYINTRTGGYGRNGIPDLLCCYRGMFVAIEVKRPIASSQASKPEERELAAITRAKGFALIARSKQDVADALDAIDRQLANGRQAA